MKEIHQLQDEKAELDDLLGDLPLEREQERSALVARRREIDMRLEDYTKVENKYLLQSIGTTEDGLYCWKCPMLEEDNPGFCRAFEAALDAEDMKWTVDGYVAYKLKREDACIFWSNKTSRVLTGWEKTEDF